MKSHYFLIIVLALFIAGCSASSSTSDSNGKASKNEKKDASYMMIAKDGNYKAYLPYFGKAHNASYGGSGNLSVNSSKRQAISYYGHVTTPSEKE